MLEVFGFLAIIVMAGVLFYQVASRIDFGG